MPWFTDHLRIWLATAGAVMVVLDTCYFTGLAPFSLSGFSFWESLSAALVVAAMTEI